MFLDKIIDKINLLFSILIPAFICVLIYVQNLVYAHKLELLAQKQLIMELQTQLIVLNSKTDVGTLSVFKVLDNSNQSALISYSYLAAIAVSIGIGIFFIVQVQTLGLVDLIASTTRSTGDLIIGSTTQIINTNAQQVLESVSTQQAVVNNLIDTLALIDIKIDNLEMLSLQILQLCSTAVNSDSNLDGLQNLFLN